MFVAQAAYLAMVAAGQKGQGAAEVYRRAKGAVVTVRTKTGSGTGFVIGDGRLVVTAYHVVKDDWFQGVSVDLPGEDDVRYVGGDEDHDVALLELKHPIKTRLTLRSSTPPTGSRIFVIGNPLGFLESTITEGIVSGLRKGGDNALLQISASVSHGNSGGPVLDESGAVVGLVKGTIEEGQGLNFAVSSYVVRQVVERLKSEDLALAMRYSLDAPTTNNTGKVVIGRLARAKRAVLIYATPSKSARVLARARSGLTLIVQNDGGRWLSVVMNDHRIAYVPADAVEILPYEYIEERSQVKVRLKPHP